MNKILFVFFAGLGVASAIVNPFIPVLKLFKGGDIPTKQATNEGVKEVIAAFKQVFLNRSVSLPDITESFVGRNGHVAEISFTGGKLFGIHTLYVDKDVDITHDDHFVDLLIHYKYKKLTASYNFIVQHYGKGPEGTIVVEITDSHLHLDVWIDRKIVYSIFNSKVTNTNSDSIKVQGSKQNTLRGIATDSALEDFFGERIDQKVRQLLQGLAVDYNSTL